MKHFLSLLRVLLRLVVVRFAAKEVRAKLLVDHLLNCTLGVLVDEGFSTCGGV